MSEGDTAPVRRIFISHARADEAWVAWMTSVLADAGVEVVRAHDAPPGTQLFAAVQEAIAGADELWVVHSAASASAPSVASELAVAIAAARPITYMLVDEHRPHDLETGTVRLFDVRDDSLRRLEARLRGAIGRPVPRPTLADEDPHPASGGGLVMADAPSALAPVFPAPVASAEATVMRPRLMTALEQALPGDAGGEGRMVVLAGSPGSGKSHLAAEFASQRRWGYRDVAWVRAAELPSAASRLAKELFGAPRGKVLVVVDDLVDATELEPLAQLPPNVDLLVTARSGTDLESVRGRRFTVIAVDSRLTHAEARELARRSFPNVTAGSVDRMVDATGGNPLLLSALLHATASWGAGEGEPTELLDVLGRAIVERSGHYYLDTDDPRLIAEWERAFERLADEGSAIDLAEFERGSWRRSWRRRYSPERTQEILNSAERAAEVAALARPESDANRNNAEAIARLIEASTAIPNLVVVSGSVLLIKVTDQRGARIVSKTLTATQLRAFEANDRLLSHPSEALEFLAAPNDERPPLAEGA